MFNIQPRYLITNENVLYGNFYYSDKTISFVVELHIAFPLRHNDILWIYNSHYVARNGAYVINGFRLNLNNTVTISAVLSF